jgi:hypothetical protein
VTRHAPAPRNCAPKSVEGLEARSPFARESHKANQPSPTSGCEVRRVGCATDTRTHGSRRARRLPPTTCGSSLTATRLLSLIRHKESAALPLESRTIWSSSACGMRPSGAPVLGLTNQSVEKNGQPADPAEGSTYSQDSISSGCVFGGLGSLQFAMGQTTVLPNGISSDSLRRAVRCRARRCAPRNRLPAPSTTSSVRRS